MVIVTVLGPSRPAALAYYPGRFEFRLLGSVTASSTAGVQCENDSFDVAGAAYSQCTPIGACNPAPLPTVDLKRDPESRAYFLSR